jgi:hypothetical protein
LRRYPFTLILKRSVQEPAVQALRIKLDPGSRTTGIAIMSDRTGEVIFAAEIVHRSQQIKKALDSGRKNILVIRPAIWVRAMVPSGKYQGVHVGRVLARATGKFDIATGSGKAQGILSQYCRPIHQSDGYSYTKGERHSSPA